MKNSEFDLPFLMYLDSEGQSFSMDRKVLSLVLPNV